MSESPTGRGYGQGSPSYNKADVDQMDLEDIKKNADGPILALFQIIDATHEFDVDRAVEIRTIAEEAIRAYARAPGPEAQECTGVDDLHKFPEDPNFGDYNIPPGRNHP